MQVFESKYRLNRTNGANHEGATMKCIYALTASLLIVGSAYSMERGSGPRQKKQREEEQQEIGFADGFRGALIIVMILNPSIMNEIKFKDLSRWALLFGGGVLAKEGYNWWNQRDNRNEN